MMYMTFATIFIAQAYNIQLGLAQNLVMLLVMMVTSKGDGRRPALGVGDDCRNHADVRIPQSGLLLIMAVDHFLDMGRSATNVLGNAVAASVIASWEGVDLPERAADQGRPGREASAGK